MCGPLLQKVVDFLYFGSRQVPRIGPDDRHVVGATCPWNLNVVS